MSAVDSAMRNRMMRFILKKTVGQTFGKLKIQSLSHVTEGGAVYLNAKCACGRDLKVIGSNLVRKCRPPQQSCRECSPANKYKGKSQCQLYQRWHKMGEQRGPEFAEYLDFYAFCIAIIPNYTTEMRIEIRRKRLDAKWSPSNIIFLVKRTKQQKTYSAYAQ